MVLFEYGNLRHLENDGWILIKDGENVNVDAEGFVNALNELGADGWELVDFQEKIGYIFKREVK